MRLFIACEIPADVRKELVTLQKTIGEEKARIKWVEPENTHLTLKFLGEVDEDKVDAIKDRLGEIRSEPIDAHASGLGVFPSESYIRVIWVGLEPASEIEKLHEKIDKAMSELGFRAESRFQTHVTIGRVRSIKNKEYFIKRITELKGRWREIGEHFRIDRFKLKKSTLTPNGPIYEDVAVIGLR
jgi:2'-5' RNA ligase